MPLYRNHFRRSRDAPGCDNDQPNSTSQGREVNRTDIDAGYLVPDASASFLHPKRTPHIQTFCLPVSLIRLASMTEQNQLLRLVSNSRRPYFCRRCCRETLA